MIGLCETWLEPEDEVTWNDYESASVNVRKGQGITTFTKLSMDVVLRIGNDKYSIIAHQSKDWLIVFMYISQQAPLNNIVGIISDLLKQTNGPILIVGDMNWDYLAATNDMKEFFLTNNFI